MFILSLLIDKASAVYKYEVSSFHVTDGCIFCIFAPYLLSSVMNQSWTPSLYPKTVSPAICLVDTGFWLCVLERLLSLWQEQLSEHKKRPFAPVLLHPYKTESKAGLQFKQCRVCCGNVGTGGPLSHQIILIRTVARQVEGLRFNRIVPLLFPFI